MICYLKKVRKGHVSTRDICSLKGVLKLPEMLVIDRGEFYEGRYNLDLVLCWDIQPKEAMVS